MIINAATISKMSAGLRTIFNGAFTGAASSWDQVAMLVNSTAKHENYAWLGAMPNFREWVGDRVVNNLMAHDYLIKNKPFEMTIAVDRDDIEDDSYGVYMPMIQEMGRAAKVHPDQLVYALLKSGFNTPCYDGQYFFDTDHPVLDEAGAVQSVSNSGGGAGTPWYLLDTSRAVKPLIFQKRRDYSFVAMDQATDEQVFSKKLFRYGVDARANAGFGLWQLAYGSKQTLDATAYANARAALGGIKGDGGRPLGIMGTLLVVPPSLEAAGKAVLEAEALANGGTNVWRNTAKLLVCPWL